MTIVLDGSSGITAPGGTAAAPSITTTGDVNTGIFFPAADTIAFSEGGVEAARFNSSGFLGIGTSSPTVRVHAYSGTTMAQMTVDGAGAIKTGINFASSGTTYGQIYFDNNSPYNMSVLQQYTTGSLIFGTNNTERLRLDSSGNLGLGVTPSAWNSSWKAIEIGNRGNALTNNAANSIGITSNAVLDSVGWKYVANGFANFMAVGNGAGQYAWNIAASGTAGNAITFTQAMTLDASGNLGIGTSSPTSVLYVAGGTNDQLFRVGNTNAVSSQYLSIYANGSEAYYNSVNTQNATYGSHVWNAQNNGGTVERARITSAGDFLVGTTAVPNVGITGQFGFSVSSSEVVISKSGADGLIIRTTSAASNNIRLYNLNNQVGSVSTTTTATAYNTSSDYRLKNTIAPITGALAKVALLKPCTYKWNADGSDGQGFIAHELAEVCPYAVTGKKDDVNKDGSIKPQGIDTSFLVATLTAAIQELKAEFDAYKASHP